MKPGGISSQWWVTRTSGGLAGSSASVGQVDQKAFAGAEIQAGEGFVQQDHLGIAHQGPGQEHLLALALRDHAERPLPQVAHSAALEQLVGPFPVVTRVACSTRSRAHRVGRWPPPRGQ